MAPIVRPAEIADAEGIAEVHVASWRAAYRGIVPDAYLDELDVEARAAMWREGIASRTGPSGIFVAAEGKDILGFAAGGRARDAVPYEAELHAIYVRPDLYGAGLGAPLFEAAAGHLRALGFSSMYLWVIARNVIGRRFYEKMGGQRDPAHDQAFEIGGTTIAEHLYAWADLTALRR